MNPIQSLNEVLLVLALDLKENGGQRPTDSETRVELQALSPAAQKIWGPRLPALGTALDAALVGRGKDQALAVLATQLEAIAQSQKGPEAALLQSLIEFFKTEDPEHWSRIVSLADTLDNAYAQRRLSPPKSVDSGQGYELRSVVQALVGRLDTRLTPEEEEIASVTNVFEVKKYRELRAVADEVFDEAVRMYVRDSGQERVPYIELRAAVIARGIDHAMPEGFNGMVDENQDWYSVQGLRIDGRVGPEFNRILMNPDNTDGNAPVFIAYPTYGGKPVPFYTEVTTVSRSRTRWEEVSNMTVALPSIQEKWLPFIQNFDGKTRSVLALVLELSATYGAPLDPSLAVAGSVTQVRDAVTVDYMVGGAKVKVVVPNGPVSVLLLQLTQGKRGIDPLFTTVHPTGNLYPVSVQDVAKMFRMCGGSPELVDSLPMVQGTRIFNELLSNLFEEIASSGTQIQNYEQARMLWIELGTQTAATLNAQFGVNTVTPVSALARMIDKSAQIEFWHMLGFRVPEYLDEALYGDLP